MWEKELTVASEAAKKAGKILNETFGRVHHIMKKGEIDLVTEADLNSEKAILTVLSEAFPKDNILSEETGNQDHLSQRTWLVDPLDGTTNFAHGFPFYCVSIALEVDQELMVGVVYNPYMNELFQAIRGQGATLNGKPIHTSQTSSISEALLGTGFPYDIHQRSEGVLDLFRRMVLVAQGVRRAGSAALDLCYVAAGRLDGFWEQSLKPWDTAAGCVILLEAGGRLSTYNGGAYDPYKNTIVGSNPFIYDEMMHIIRQANSQ
ncbi:MAG: inositol monophosphatase [Deltaproteobacteria bacterium]|nr:inositol monophosphatase [Deltaproteobacteria bacterium]MBW1927904.1 inositol monophosphatase [Deltaproteobacteria bacterium]MBW2024855.1 inositol monophosphatase [Deltaproteobacteria bacterium]MBW2124767.1 inositol monophosphatase [Deltaproteobacteria bacterium]RLB19700.1 MAG: inositol monophosphatase [Deltaproteobacteria bacterium]